MESTRHVVCPHCAAINRLPTEKRAGDGRCDACHRALFEGRPTAVNATQFDKHRRDNDIAVLVDVWAPWCAPCRAMAPMFERAAAELEPEVRLIKLNADEEPRIASELGGQWHPGAAPPAEWKDHRAHLRCHGRVAHRGLDAHASCRSGIAGSALDR
jgi:thioredoxin 2